MTYVKPGTVIKPKLPTTVVTEEKSEDEEESESESESYESETE